MPPPPDKHYYSILGVEPEASAEALRDAYWFLTRAIHPDRFDPQTQSKDWREANARMAAINEAYAVLRDPEKRKSYDDIRLGRAPSPTSPGRSGENAKRTAPAWGGEADPQPSRPDRYTSGQTVYRELPAPVQERLCRRQDGLNPDQVQIRLKSIGWTYLYLVLLAGWFFALFLSAFGSPWHGGMLIASGAVSLAAGAFIAGNRVVLLQWKKSVLKPCFYLTPIYFIKTAFDNIAFYPLWALKSDSVTHRYFGGIYYDTRVRLVFEDFTEILKFKSMADWELFDQRLYVYREMLRIELLNNNDIFFLKNDDFHGVNRASCKRNQLKGSKRLGIYVITLAWCVAAWAAFAMINKVSNRRTETTLQPSAVDDPR